MTDRLLFISDKKFLNSETSGGVQLCTREYLTYLTRAGFEITRFPVEPDKSFITRLKIKAGLEVYERYRLDTYLHELVNKIKSTGIKLVLFNQINLTGWIANLKPLLPADVKFVALSHGNESGDFLHEVAKAGHQSFLSTLRLGKILVKESQIYSQLLDGVIVLSENEVYINQWLGANSILYLPRLLYPAFLDWQPQPNRIGFVGTLDHLPNVQGLIGLFDALKSTSINIKLRLVGGPVSAGNNFALKYPFVEYIGQLTDDQLIQEVTTWSIFLNPVFWYARGASTKLAQAINWGIPCITTPAGRRGYNLYSNNISTFDNSPKSFVTKLAEALSDERHLNSLKKATEENATHFDAQQWIDQLKNFLITI
ncbi:glycosyltransferase family 4 protein [Mucilaginibacter litoreus]|uniref:Glycosyltransferase family 4 protein n=1 Tax=Mucilaginibacter litoreus TaxID=1048221 RepID=A0ABW3AX07_9SPHI